MKTLPSGGRNCGLILLLALLLLGQRGTGQGFINLNFEFSTITSSSPSGYGFDIGTANVPGWTEYYGWGDANYPGGATLVYNEQTLDSAGVSLQDTNSWTPSIQGKYSILLEGGTAAAGIAYPWMTNGASIGQTGTIPISTTTITYWVYYGAPVVTFNGQPLAANVVSSTNNYTIYSANISAYAGQTGELLFTAPWLSGWSMIDKIQFSSTPVPEPTPLALLAVGALLFMSRRLRPFTRC